MGEPLAHTYHPGRSMGHPSLSSMADVAGSSDGRVATNAIEQVAYELRTANLIQYLRDNDAIDPAYGQVMNEIRVQLGINLGDWEADDA